MVFCGLYPAGESNIDELRDALEKLKLNDASLHFEPEHSPALGIWLQAGFLGLLHREIIQERLERNLILISLPPPRVSVTG
jgi:GTP-binding protein LepA